MKNAYRKKLERAAILIHEVRDDLETEGSSDFDAFGIKLEDIAGEIDDILVEDENMQDSEDEDDDDKGYDVE